MREKLLLTRRELALQDHVSKMIKSVICVVICVVRDVTSISYNVRFFMQASQDTFPFKQYPVRPHPAQKGANFGPFQSYTSSSIGTRRR